MRIEQRKTVTMRAVVDEANRATTRGRRNVRIEVSPEAAEDLARVVGEMSGRRECPAIIAGYPVKVNGQLLAPFAILSEPPGPPPKVDRVGTVRRSLAAGDVARRSYLDACALGEEPPVAWALAVEDAVRWLDTTAPDAEALALDEHPCLPLTTIGRPLLGCPELSGPLGVPRGEAARRDSLDQIGWPRSEAVRYASDVLGSLGRRSWALGMVELMAGLGDALEAGDERATSDAVRALAGYVGGWASARATAPGAR